MCNSGIGHCWMGQLQPFVNNQNLICRAAYGAISPGGRMKYRYQIRCFVNQCLDGREGLATFCEAAMAGNYRTSIPEIEDIKTIYTVITM